MAKRKRSSWAASSSSRTAKISKGTSRRTSAAACSSTWSKSREELTSSPISTSVASASVEISATASLACASGSRGRFVSFKSMIRFFLDESADGWNSLITYYSSRDTLCGDEVRTGRVGLPAAAREPSQLFEDAHTGTSSDAGCAGGQHLRGDCQRADSACGLYSGAAADHVAQQGHVFRGGAAGAEARGSLHEIGTSAHGQFCAAAQNWP